jgi:copper(I)-binding protein
MAYRRVGVVLLASAIASVGAAGCAAGNDSLTNLARTTTNSAAGAVGPITLRNVYVAGPVAEGGSAPIVSAFFNASGDPDTLVSVSSPEATGGRLPTPAQIPPGGGEVFIADGRAPSLQGVRQNLLIGAELPITFTFAKAGSVTLDVPVEPPAPGASAAPTSASPTVASPSPTAGATRSGHPGATGSATPSAGATSPTRSATATPTAG